MSLELFKQKIKIPHNLKTVISISDKYDVSPSNKHNINVVKHYTPSTEEWNNSTYTFNKNKIVKLIPAINIIVYKLLKSYFNMNPYHKILMKHNINLKLDRS